MGNCRNSTGCQIVIVCDQRKFSYKVLKIRRMRKNRVTESKSHRKGRVTEVVGDFFVAGAVLGHVRNMMCETWSKWCNMCCNGPIYSFDLKTFFLLKSLPSACPGDWRCQVTFAKNSIRMYYVVVFDNLVATMKQRIAQVVASSWARGKMADQHLSLEEVMQKDYHGVLGPIMGKDGFCIERSDSGGVKSDTFIFQITDATVQYQTFQALMPVSYRVCAENGHMCKHAPMERISHNHGTGGVTIYETRSDCQTGCVPAACFFSRAKSTGPVLFGPGETVPGWSTTSTTSLSLDVAMERRATAATGKSTFTEETSLDSAIVGKSPCHGGRTHCRGDMQGDQYCYPNHETCDSYCPNSDADPGPTDNCDLMRAWTDLRSFESFELGGGSYSAWLCGWESDDDMSKIWMPNSNLMATIDRLVRIHTENHTQSLGEMLNPYIQGLTRWWSTIPSGWDFEIMRLPRSSFINSDDGKMMIYTQQIGQNCNWHKNSGDCARYDEFESGEYKGRCGNEPWINEPCGTEAHAPSLPVRSCETYTSPDYCNKWCNTGRGGCGIETFNDDTCDCSGCNGCPVCETVVVGPHQGSSTFVRANLTNSSFPSKSG